MVAIGNPLPSLPWHLYRNSYQARAAHFYAPTGYTLNLSDTTVFIEIDGSVSGPDLTFTAAMDTTGPVTGATAVWVISDTESAFDFDIASGRMVANVADDRTVLAHLHFTVED